MPAPRKRPNPNHPNTGRPQNFNQKLTTRLSWLAFTISGLRGNLTSALDGIEQIKRAHPKEYYQLPESTRERLRYLENETARIISEFTDLEIETKEFNATKARVGPEPMSRKERRYYNQTTHTA